MDPEQASSRTSEAQSRRGLSWASEETMQRVAKKGGSAPQQKRRLAPASAEIRTRVAKKSGDVRAQDKGRSQAGMRSDEIVRERCGSPFYREIGEKGGGAVKMRYGTRFYC